MGPREILPPAESLKAVMDAISGSRRPVIVVGNGARGQMDDVTALAEKLNAPVLTSFKAKGLISDHHPLGAGVLGRSGTPVASWFMNECDLMIVFCASFSNHTGIATYKPLIQVDYDATALGRFHPVTVPVQGHVGATARVLTDACEGMDTIDQRPEVAARWQTWREEKARRELDTTEEGISAAAVFAAMNRTIDEHAVICVDVGNNTYSFGRYCEATGQDVLMSGYLGSIGFGFPAAMGALAAAPDRPIVSISGDGGFGQYMAELRCARHDRLAER